ncbi:MAG: hypothetical protein ACXADB_08275 [Candidatus Hermodarchaeia archaeon]|jgi:hypothetical protein
MIPIYKYETIDGLAETVRSSGRLVFASQATWLTPDQTHAEKINDLLKSSSTANPNQMDLFYLESILASVGWNQNDDVFDPQEIWAARHTPVDKQFNYMHDETDIIGHLTSSKIVAHDGKIVSNETDLPSKFDIVVGSVLYRKWSDPNLQERMDKLVAEITDGKWCVSMECLFRNFDYAIITPQGEHKVLARNDESSFLTKHLRIYGGSGEFEGNRVGRLLRGFSFSGEGLVDNPANPRSKITNFNDKSEISSFTGAAATVEELEISNVQEKQMSGITQEQYDALEAKYNALEAKLAAEAAKELDDAKATIAELEKKVDTLTAELDASKEVANAKDESIEASKAELEAAKAELSEATAKLEAQEQEAIKAARKTQLLAKVDEDKADALVEKFANASDEMFEALVESLPAKCADDKDDKKKDKFKKGDASDNSDDDDDSDDDANADINTDIDDASASDDADMSSGGDDTPADTVAKAASWFTNHVLRATANKEEGE